MRTQQFSDGKIKETAVEIYNTVDANVLINKRIIPRTVELEIVSLPLLCFHWRIKCDSLKVSRSISVSIHFSCILFKKLSTCFYNLNEIWYTLSFLAFSGILSGNLWIRYFCWNTFLFMFCFTKTIIVLHFIHCC